MLKAELLSIFSIMATSTSLSTDSKRRRIMIITADTNNIDQIGKIINDTSLLAQIAFSSIGSSSESKNQQVDSIKHIYEKKNYVLCL